MSNFFPFHWQGERLPAYISRPFAFALFGPLPYIYAAAAAAAVYAAASLLCCTEGETL